MWSELTTHLALHRLVASVLEQAPPPGMPGDTGAAPPPGLSGKFTALLAGVKWIALAAIVLTFFAGIAVFTAGRVADHRHGAASGTRLMIAAAAGAVLYAIGYGVITGMASTT